MIFRRAAALMLSLCCVAVLGFDQRASAQVYQVENGTGNGQKFPASAYGTGTVSGRVVCGDTQRLARFATVSLVPKPVPAKTGAPASPANQEGGRQNSQPDSEEISLQMVQSKTGLDGSFEIQKLPAGDYYAVATMPGYTLPVSDPGESKDLDQVDINKVLENFPLVHVDPNRSSSVDLTMQRGAVIAGRVMYEDGSPATNVYVSVATTDGKDPIHQYPGVRLQQLAGAFAIRTPLTDDDGRYRIAGLLPGKYIVSVSLQMQGTMRMTGNQHSSSGRPDQQSNSGPTLIYAPGVFHKSDAKPVEVHAGEVNSTADVEVNLSGLHHVIGRVLALSDRHPISNVSLFLSLGREFGGSAIADEDGNFHFDYVPEGNYILHVQAFDMKLASRPDEQPKILGVYASPKTPVVVAGQDVVLGEILLTAGKMSEMGIDMVEDSVTAH